MNKRHMMDNEISFKTEINKKEKLKLMAWEFVKYFIVVINSIAAIASIFGLFVSVISKDKISIAFYATCIIIVVVVLITILAVLKSGKNDKMEEARKYAKGFHEILHLIRDSFGDLLDVIDDETYSNANVFRKYMTERIMKMMDVLANNLTEATGNKVRACIKSFDFIRERETDKKELKLITLARSGKNNVNNMISEHYKTISVTENSDFEYIFNISEEYVEERVHFFIVDDLKKYSKKNEYKNSNPKWYKNYSTTIVMPIRCLKNSQDEVEVSNNTEYSAYYDILGCLCIDSKKTNLFSVENRGFVLEYLKGISDILYVYLSECIFYYDYLKGKKNND